MHLVIPTLLLARGAPKVGPGMASILSSSELLITVIVAAIVLIEPVSMLQWIGVITILVGICSPHFCGNK